MKRSIWLFLVLFLFIMSGCENFNSNQNDNNDDDDFVVNDSELNQTNFDSLNNELERFGSVLEKSDYLTMNIFVEASGQRSSQVIRAANDPLYFEISSGSEKYIIVQEDDKMFQYTDLGYSYYDREYLGTVSDYDSSNNEDNSEELLETTFDKEKCNITRKDNKYTVKCYFKDALNKESKEMLEDIYEASGVSIDVLYNSVLTMTYTIYSDKISMDLLMNVEDESISRPIKVKLSFDIDVSKFTPMDMLNGDYNISAPDCFEEIYEVYDFYDVLELDSVSTAYLKIEAEKGMIVARNENIGLELYDMDKNKVSESMGKTGSGSYIQLDSYLPVKEEGTYYLIVKNRISEDQNVKLDMYEYDTVVSDEAINLDGITSLEGEIEGKYDFERYVYTNNDTTSHTIRIENIGNDKVVVFKNEKWYSKEVLEIKPNETKFLVVNPGENEIFICQNFMSSKYLSGYSYKLNIRILEFAVGEHILETPIPNEFELEPFDNLLYYTYVEKGLYSILEKDGYSWHHKVNVYNKDGKKLDVNIVEQEGYLEDIATRYVIPEDDWYYIGIKSGISGAMTLVHTKYDYETIGDKNNPILLDVKDVTFVKGFLEGTHDFEYYRINNDTDDIKVYCITNQSDQYFNVIVREYANTYPMELQVAVGGKICFAVYPGGIDFMVLHYISKVEDKTLEYSFNITELENNNITDINSPNLKEVTTEFSDDYYMAGYGLAETYMKLNLKETGVVRFDYLDFYFGTINNHGLQGLIYDLDGNLIRSEVIEAGEYYVKFASSSFSRVKIKYTFFSTKEQNVNVTLKELDSTYNNSKYSDIYNLKVTNDHVIKYHFTLTEKSTVYYRSQYVTIYNENDELAVLVPTRYWDDGTMYVDLEAGNYYFTSPKAYGSTSDERSIIPIGIKSIERDAPQDFSNMQVLNIGESKTVKQDFNVDVEYFEFTITEAGKYRFSIETGRGYVYNENKEFVNYIGLFPDNYLNLTEGTYYLVIEYSDYMLKSNSITIQKD